MRRNPWWWICRAAVQRLQNARGSVILALLVISSMVLMGIPMTTINMSENRFQTRSTGDVTSLSAADSGLSSVLWEYNHDNPAFPGNTTCTGYRTPLPCCLGNTQGCWYQTPAASCPSASKTPAGICRQWNQPLTITSGKVSVVNIFVDDVNGLMYGRQPTVTLDGYRYATMTPGGLKQVSQNDQVPTRITAKLGPVNPPRYSQPVRARDPLFLGVNSIVDSYDRSLGAYGLPNLDVSQAPYGVLNKSSASDPQSWQATVQTISTLTSNPWAIQMNLGSLIFGDAIIGQSGNPTWAINLAGGANVYGSERAATAAEQTENSSQLAAIPTFTVTPGPNPVFTNSDCSTNSIPPFTVNAAANNYSTIDVAQNCVVYVDVSGNQRLDLSRVYIGIDGRLEFRKTVAGPAKIDLYVDNEFYVRDGVNVVLPQDLTVAVHANDRFYAGIGSRINATADALPSKFIVEVSGGADNDVPKEVDIRSDATLLAMVRAPSGEMDIGDRVNFYGAAIAKEITINTDTHVHYDVSQQNACENPSCTDRGGVETKLWQRPAS